MGDLASHADIYSQQRRNRRITMALIFGLSILLGLLGYAVDAYSSGTLAIRGIPVATLLALAFAGINGFVSYFYGQDIVLGSLHAHPLVFENPSHKKLHNVVTEMSLASGIAMPKIYFIADPAPNAFAAGRYPGNAVIGVTEGLLDVMSREELQAVVAHEVGHIKNNDILTMTVVTVLVGTVVLLSDWARRAWRLGGRRGREKTKSLNPFILLLIILLILVAPIFSRVIAMAVSRQREYQADASAAEFTRNPLALASALEKIAQATSPLREAHRGTAHLFISDPLQRKLDDREGLVADLLSTHPPIQNRIHRLKRMAYVYSRPAVGQTG
jgi:heat shock protein HtpX